MSSFKYQNLSRRQVLATSGGALTTGSFGGCLSQLGLAKTGHLQLKVISLEWEYNGQLYRDEPLWCWFDREEREIGGRYDPAFVGESVRAPDDIVVTEERYQLLSTHFTVEYLLGVCGEDFVRGEESSGCQNRWTTRTDFNRVQLNDRAEVRLPKDRFDVVDVYEDTYPVRSTDVRTFDFAELHKDHGITPGDR